MNFKRKHGPNFFKSLSTFPKSTKPLFYIFKVTFQQGQPTFSGFQLIHCSWTVFKSWCPCTQIQEQININSFNAMQYLKILWLSTCVFTTVFSEISVPDQRVITYYLKNAVKNLSCHYENVVFVIGQCHFKDTKNKVCPYKKKYKKVSTQNRTRARTLNSAPNLYTTKPTRQ